MSVQFGKCNFDGKRVDPKDLDRVRPVLSSYGPDGEGYLCKEGLGMLYRALHTTAESCREEQPYTTPSGSLITWDGRLDNREELVHDMGHDLLENPTDLAVVAACYEKWGTASFSKLIGDWALSIWNPRSHSLLLAKDFIGVRHLYYSIHEDQLMWSTILDPLILFSSHPVALDEEYIAGWFSLFPETHLTPYVGIRSVPPGCFVRLDKSRETVTKYWDFDGSKKIRYRDDRDYEEDFRRLFAESVRRRLRSNKSVSAELSGGIDSSSIVCVADRLLEQGLSLGPRINTVSYYDDRELNWNELPYLAKVEQMRGQLGFHIDLSLDEPRKPESVIGRFMPAPTFDDPLSNSSKQFAAYLVAQGSCVVLSGLGGDEVTGGVPAPLPELTDLLAKGKLRRLAHKLKSWALNKRKPWFHLLVEVIQQFVPGAFIGSPYKQPATLWLNRQFAGRNRAALAGNRSRLRLFGPLPSIQQNLRTLSALQRQLGCTALPSEPPHEKRYPYLDRNLLEFLFAIPPGQLVRPGQRRSLMRRALAGIVPDEVLNRRRKAFAARGPLAALVTEWTGLLRCSQPTATGSLGIIDPVAISKVLQGAESGREIPLTLLARALALEWWLRELQQSPAVRHISFEFRNPSPFQAHSAAVRTVFSAENNQNGKEVTNDEVLKTPDHSSRNRDRRDSGRGKGWFREPRPSQAP